MSGIPHTFQYQGSKRNLAQAILGYFPERVSRFVEVFAGSAALSIASAYFSKSKSFWINDLNGPLLRLLELIIEHPSEVAEEYEKIWNCHQKDHVEYYNYIRDKFNKTHDPVLFLYILSRCVKGAVRYNAHGQFNQGQDKRRYGTKPHTVRQNFLMISSLLKGKTEFSVSDYQDVLADARKDDLVYLDPPYQGVCGSRDQRYLSGIDHDSFIAALERLNSRGISYIVSYDGRRGNKQFGNTLPDNLKLKRIELSAGRSSQSTLLGRHENTYESLYVTQDLVKDSQNAIRQIYKSKNTHQLSLFGL